MNLTFAKLHGAGNDFVLIDARGLNIDIASRAAFLADRHFGIGCDQVLLLDEAGDGDLRMTVLNADGSAAEMCGNGIRAFARYAWDHGLRPHGPLPVWTGAGRLVVTPQDNGGAETTMGRPVFDFAAIAADAAAFGRAATDEAWPLNRAGWLEPARDGTGVSMGNPHLVFFVADPGAVDLAALGPRLEHDPAFRRRINVSFAAVRAGRIEARVWERGAGMTLACGTAACAIAVAAQRRGLIAGPVDLVLPGGTLRVDWRPGDEVRLAGPAEHVFSGSVRLGAAAAMKEAQHV